MKHEVGRVDAVAARAQGGLSALFSRRRLARVASFSSLQLLVQALGWVAGLILVRALAQADYGHYTIVIAMVGLGAVLFDLGLANAVLAHGGRDHDAPALLARLLGDAFDLQRRLTLVLALPLVALFALMLHGHGVEPFAFVALLALALASSWLSARNALWLAVARLRGDLRLQQGLELGVNLGRSLAIAAAALVYIDAVVAAALVAVAAAASHAVLTRHFRPLLGDPGLACDGSFRLAIADFVRRQAPNSLYYCIHGQVAVWLVGWFGSTADVAGVGALGRLAMLFTVAGALVAAFVQPYFARPRPPADLMQAFVAINSMFAVACVLLVLSALLAPQALLAVLGPNYAGLGREVVWMVLSSTLAAWSGAVYSMGAARGWLVPGVLLIPVGVASLALGAAIFDFGSVLGAFQLNTLSGAATLALMTAHVTVHLRRHAKAASTRGGS